MKLRNWEWWSVRNFQKAIIKKRIKTRSESPEQIRSETKQPKHIEAIRLNYSAGSSLAANRSKEMWVWIPLQTLYDRHLRKTASIPSRHSWKSARPAAKAKQFANTVAITEQGVTVRQVFDS